MLIFLTPYFASHSLHTVFLRGVRGARQAPGFGILGVPNLAATGAWTVPLLALLGVAAYSGQRWARVRDGSVICALLLILAGSGKYTPIYRFGWYPVVMTVPVIIVMGALLLLRVEPSPRQKSSELFLLLAVAALCSLVEYPFSAPIYFCYVAPLAILAIVALIAALPGNRPFSRVLLAALVGFYTLFAAFRVTPGFIYHMGQHYVPDLQTTALNLDRAGRLRVTSQEAGVYEQLVPMILPACRQL